MSNPKSPKTMPSRDPTVAEPHSSSFSSSSTSVASSPPHQGQVKTRGVPSPVVIGDAQLGRRVNRLPDFYHLLDGLPDAARVVVLEHLAGEAARRPDALAQMIERPLCDGKGHLIEDPTEYCCLMDATNGADEFLHEARRDPAISALSTVPFRCNRLVDSAYIRELCRLDPDNIAVVRSLESMVLDKVEEEEHKLHAVGIKPTRKHGYDMARIHMMKVISSLLVLFSVPLVDASPTPTSVVWEVTANASFEYWSWLRDLFQHWVVIILAFLTSGCSVVSNSADGIVWFVARNFVDLWWQTVPDSFEACTMLASSPGWCYIRWLYYSFAFREDETYLDLYFAEGRAALSYDLYATIWKFSPVILGVCVVVFAMTLLTFRAFVSVVKDLVQWYATVRAIKQASFRYSTPVESVDPERPQDDRFGAVSRVLKSVSQAIHDYSSRPVLLEMSVAGSAMQKSRHVGGLCQILLKTDVLSPIGMAFRFGEYLVTVNHNLTAALSTPGEILLVPFMPSGDYSKLHAELYYSLSSEFLDSNIVPPSIAQMYDLAIFKVGNKIFSKLKLSSLQAASAVWDSAAVVYGLHRNDPHLYRAIGTILKSSRPDNFMRVEYNASTKSGWSGSPVLNGNKVMAVHRGTDGQYNNGVNIALVQRLIDFHEKIKLEHSEDIRFDESEAVWRDRYGAAADYEDYGFDEGDLGYAFRSKRNGKVSWGEREYFEQYQRGDTRKWGDYDDETTLAYENAAPLKLSTVPALPETESEAFRPRSPKKDSLFGFAHEIPLVMVKTATRLSAPYFKGFEPKSLEALDLDRAKSLGYKEGVYQYPEILDKASSVAATRLSLHLHLQSAVATRLTSLTPAAELRRNAVHIVLHMLRPLQFTMCPNPVTKERLMSFINSSSVKDSNSPGLPFTAHGFQTNADVIAHYGPDGLADLILRHYENGTYKDIPAVTFFKCEPTKVEKLEAGMVRVVHAVSLVVQCLFRCFFADQMDVMAKNYKRNPVMGGWSPLKVGDAEYFVDTFRGLKKHKLFFFDGITFDTSAHSEWAYHDLSRIMVSLARRSENMSCQEEDRWRSEASEFLENVGRSGYQLPDGTLINKLVAWLLSSGRFDTFFRNSGTGLYFDVLTKLEMGYTKDEITGPLFVVKVGGDDNLQKVPKNFDVAKYKSIIEKYGLKIHKEGLVSQFDGIEFFSWIFKYNDGLPSFVPARFTKHVEAFKAAKFEIWPESLPCAMANYMHDREKYNFFHDLFLKGRAINPDLFRAELVPDRDELIAHVRGNEYFKSDFDYKDLMNRAHEWFANFG